MRTPGSTVGDFRRVPWRSLGCAFRIKEDARADRGKILLATLTTAGTKLRAGMSTVSGKENPPVEPQGHMEIIRVERPFEKVGMDILGPFPVSVGGKKNIIVAVDYLTKWAETSAVPTATARDAAEFFVEKIVLRHGAQEGVITDCGNCFVAEFTKEVMRLMEVDHRTTTPYHPQANGLVDW